MHEVPFGEPGWSEELIAEFVEMWLADWYLHAPQQPGLLEQMDDYCQASWRVSAETFTHALVEDLNATEDEEWDV